MCQHPVIHAIQTVLATCNLSAIAMTCHEFDDSDVLEWLYLSLVVMNGLWVWDLFVKLLGYTWKSFWADLYNSLNLFVVVSFFSAYGYDCYACGGSAQTMEQLEWTRQLAVVNVLRGLMLLKIFSSLSVMKPIIESMQETGRQTFVFLILLAIAMYVFALLGLQTFAGKLRFDVEGNPLAMEEDEPAHIPRMNFDSLTWALMSVFQVLMGNRWNELFYDCIRGAGLSVTMLYFGGLILLGYIVLL